MQTDLLSDLVFGERRDVFLSAPDLSGPVRALCADASGCLVFVSCHPARLLACKLRFPPAHPVLLFFRGMEDDLFTSSLHRLHAADRLTVLLQPELLTDAVFARTLAGKQISAVVVLDGLRASWKSHRFYPGFALLPAFMHRYAIRPPMVVLSAFSGKEQEKAAAALLELRSPDRLIFPVPPFRPILRVLSCHSPAEREELLLRLSGNFGRAVFCCSGREETSLVYTVLARQSETVHLLTDDMPPLSLCRELTAIEEDTAPVAAAIDTLPLLLSAHIGHLIFPSMPDALTDCAAFLLFAKNPGFCGTILFCETDRAASSVRLRRRLSCEDYPIRDREAADMLIREWEKEIDSVRSLCTGTRCLSDGILTGAGYPAQGICGCCSVCDPAGEFADVTEDAAAVLSCVKASGEILSAVLLRKVLCGTLQNRNSRSRLSALPYAGALSSRSETYVRALIDRLIRLSFLWEAPDAVHRTLRIGSRAESVLAGKEAFFLPQEDVGPLSDAEAALLGRYADPQLCRALRAFRSELSAAEQKPTYLLFGNFTLHALAVLRPKTREALYDVPRMPERTAERYGDRLLSILNLPH